MPSPSTTPKGSIATNGTGGGTPASPKSSNGGSTQLRWSVIVGDPINEGTGRNMHTTYSVSTEKTAVRRRYIDFCWLYDRLMTEVPGAIIPIIPHKYLTMPNQKFLPEFIEQRRSHLEQFLTTVVMHDELVNAPSMKPFMTCTIEQLEDAKKTIETLNPTGSLGPAGQEDDDHDLNLQRAGAGDVPGSPGGTGASAGGGRFGKGLANMFAKAATIARVNTGNFELEETKEEPEIIAMKNYITEVETHIKQLLTAATSLVKSTNDTYTGIHTLGVPFSGWKDSHLNHIVNNIEVTEGDVGEDDTCMSHMTSIIALSDTLAGIKEQQNTDEKNKFEAAIEHIQYQVKAFQLALKKRRTVQVNYTTKQKQIHDKTLAIEKVKSKGGANSDKLIVKLEMEKMELEAESNKLKDLLTDTSVRVLRETKRIQPQLEAGIVECVIEYGKLQILYNEQLTKAWKKALPKLGDKEYEGAITDDEDELLEKEEEAKPTITSV